MAINEKRQHNLRLPVSRLPNEALSKLFCNLRNDYVLVPIQRNKNGLKDWITVTHVCHTWRQVALNTPLLWCHIDFLPLAVYPKPQDLLHSWIPELLRRSKQSPLTLLTGWDAHKCGILGEMKMHFGRVRNLILDFPNEDTLQGVFSTNFQNLEMLEISRTSYGRLVQRRDQGTFILNDSNLRAEYIRHLDLEFCSIDCNNKFLQGLTYLRLVNIPDGRLGCHDFLLVLSKIPALETLHLSDFLAEQETTEGVKVHLQNLQHLTVQCAVPEMAQFLPCLVIPRSCILRINTWNEYDEVCDKFCAILLWVSNQLRVHPLPTSNAGDHEKYIRSFRLEHDPERVDFNVKGFCDVLSHEQMKSAGPILEFGVVWTYEDDNFSFNLQTFLSLLPLDGLAFLDVVTDFDVYLSPEFWTVAFGSIQTLKTIHLNTNTANFWEALALKNSDHSAVKSLPFSALASVTVDDFLLDSQLLLDKLRVRSELGGTQLQDLLFSSYSEDEGVPPATMMVQLGELVSHIQVVKRGNH